MKLEEKLEAKKMRQQGHSINEIKNKLNVAKSSVSLWVRNIELSPQQKNKLSKKGVQFKNIEKRRSTRLKNEATKRQLIIDAAQSQVKKLSSKELWLVGSILYWAEGGKTQRALVRFSNGDPEMIRIMMKFFKKICKVPDEKFRGYIHIHPHLDYKKAEKYWSDISGIPRAKFFKTYRKTNIASKSKKNTLPYGTFDIYICSTELFLKIQGWVEGIFNSY